MSAGRGVSKILTVKPETAAIVIFDLHVANGQPTKLHYSQVGGSGDLRKTAAAQGI